ncbi:hypothetical protein [Clostridium sp.]|uniref:hypothetical protein n=1 Tax=Clostridium sp. TaxID=1506 RepID=UPI003D6CDD60
MKANLNEVWELIDCLTLEEKKIIYKKMEVDINLKLIDLLDRVSERVEKESLSLDDITKEVEEVRGNFHEQN